MFTVTKLLNWIRPTTSPAPAPAKAMFEEMEGRLMFSGTLSTALETTLTPPAITATRQPAVKRTITLTDTQTGLRVSAPRGYTLKANNGIYTLSNGKVYARFMLARTTLKLAEVRNTFIKESHVTKASRTGKGSNLTLTGKLNSQRVTVKFTQVSKGLVDIVTYGDVAKSKKSPSMTSAPSVRMPSVSVSDIVNLQRILTTRRGGIIVPLPITVPTKRFTAPDGGSSALVPNLPGWNYTGGGGEISGGNITQGLMDLGVPVMVSRPGFPGAAAPVSEPLAPDAAIAVVWPQFVASRYGAQVQVTGVSLVPGTAGWLGPNFISGLYAIRFNFNGQTWQGLMSSGCFDTGTSLGWGWYHSYIAVSQNAPAGIGAALVNAWSTWDNSVASTARLAQAIRTVLSTRVSGFPIDPEVFEEAAFKWDAYIRE